MLNNVAAVLESIHAFTDLCKVFSMGGYVLFAVF